MSIRIRDAFVAAVDHRFTHEIGGYFTNVNGLRFYKTSESRVVPGDTRMSIRFPTNKRHYWHTHPPTAGWWPSVEDILRNDAKHVLFTRFGSYIWSNSGGKNINTDALLAVWRPFHKYMEKKSQAHWTPEEIVKRIQLLSVNLKRCCGTTFVFLPLFYIRSEQDIRDHVEAVRRTLSV